VRVNVYETADDEAGRSLAGWFDYGKADRWSDRDPLNGHGCGGIGRGEAVLRTAKGLWVLEYWTAWSGEESTYTYIAPERARDWLLRHDEDDVVARYFGVIEEVRAPGRPEIGAPVQVRLGADLLGRVDAWATERGVKRAEAIRQLVASALL
jgi:hypothetical protein